ncbi:hypothetical protein L596_002108 [Steinernema carpocapsae]|uniref:Uncharacterized protein n=1 Tax=Steinernema carpocapsae TaxID=34508 RepID=A0A4U8UQV9_STECR|nr:hypothetical protein L596_002108 [Steinernema carpocapsae]
MVPRMIGKKKTDEREEQAKSACEQCHSPVGSVDGRFDRSVGDSRRRRSRLDWTDDNICERRRKRREEDEGEDAWEKEERSSLHMHRRGDRGQRDARVRACVSVKTQQHNSPRHLFAAKREK